MEFITSTREYDEVFKSHQKIEGKQFKFLKKKTPEKKFKVGIIVGRKVGKAVIRNKIKRQIKAFFRENEAILPGHQKIVIIGKKEAAKASWQQIKNELQKILEVQ